MRARRESLQQIICVMGDDGGGGVEGSVQGPSLLGRIDRGGINAGETGHPRYDQTPGSAESA